ncbi:MAG: Precorrin-3B methylase [Phormidesmis sp.]
MPKSKKQPDGPLEGDALIKETCRRIRAAKGLWDAHRNAACRHEREKALALYNQLTKAQKDNVPQQLRIWLRYRSEKYFGAHQTPLGGRPQTPLGGGNKAKRQKKRSGKRRSGKKNP